MKIVTIGVYGFSAETFFAALRQAGGDTFCDLRSRRGVRGSDYVFANRRRLQARLEEMGLRYFHFRELAPSAGLRARQAAADRSGHIAKSRRTRLSKEFRAGYRQECLRAFDSRQFVAQLGPEARVAVLFCVEREPAACHRSLLAERLQQDLGIEVIHLRPDG
jgi:uncharacterized protein (DUF488 family)